MHRIDSDGHVSNLYNEGDPLVPRLPTQMDAAAMNALQEELASLIVARGVTLVKGTNTQLATALATVTRANLTLAANWSTSGGFTVRSYVDACGAVHIEGQAAHSSNGQEVVITTLPAGQRPPRTMVFPASTSGEDPCYVVVFSTGVVWAKKFTDGDAIGTSAVCLDGITFHP